jgi:hypothetical protein
MLGIAQASKGYKVLNTKTNETFITRNVKFYENNFYVDDQISQKDEYKNIISFKKDIVQEANRRNSAKENVNMVHNDEYNKRKANSERKNEINMVHKDEYNKRKANSERENEINMVHKDEYNKRKANSERENEINMVHKKNTLREKIEYWFIEMNPT